MNFKDNLLLRAPPVWYQEVERKEEEEEEEEEKDKQWASTLSLEGEQKVRNLLF